MFDIYLVKLTDNTYMNAKEKLGVEGSNLVKILGDAFTTEEAANVIAEKYAGVVVRLMLAANAEGEG